MKSRDLTSLELTALGIVYKQTKVIAHDVVQHFSTSQTLAYRSGAGSIYPLLKRLTASGHLSLVDRYYEITPKGLQALKEWLSPPFTHEDISANLDMIRSRVYFLRLLEPDERRAFILAAIERLEELRANCSSEVAANESVADNFSACAMLGALRETEARIQWLREIQDRLA